MPFSSFSLITPIHFTYVAAALRFREEKLDCLSVTSVNFPMGKLLSSGNRPHGDRLELTIIQLRNVFFIY